MQELFSEGSLSVTYFILISAGFFNTLLIFFNQKAYREYKWAHHLGICLLILLWILTLISEPLATRMFAMLMLMSAIIIEAAIRRKRRKLP
jgi:uncharacterized membrane protein